MKTKTVLTAATIIAGSLLTAQAEPKDEVQNAIKALTDKANYSWTSTSKRPERPDGDAGANNRWGGGPTQGKTADGYVHLSTVRGDRTSESLRKGDKIAFKRDDGWAVFEPRTPAGGDQGERRGRGPGGFGGAFTAPDAQAADLLGKVAELKKDGDVYEGPLTEEAAKALVSFGGNRRGGAGGGDNAARPEPKDVKASAKFWVKDGVLVKYETSASGSITFNETARDLSRTTTVEISEVGSTKIDVPEDAKQKLAAEKAPAESKSEPEVK